MTFLHQAAPPLAVCGISLDDPLGPTAAPEPLGRLGAHVVEVVPAQPSRLQRLGHAISAGLRRLWDGVIKYHVAPARSLRARGEVREALARTDEALQGVCNAFMRTGQAAATPGEAACLVRALRRAALPVRQRADDPSRAAAAILHERACLLLARLGPTRATSLGQALLAWREAADDTGVVARALLDAVLSEPGRIHARALRQAQAEVGAPLLAVTPASTMQAQAGLSRAMAGAAAILARHHLPADDAACRRLVLRGVDGLMDPDRGLDVAREGLVAFGRFVAHLPGKELRAFHRVWQAADDTSATTHGAGNVLDGQIGMRSQQAETALVEALRRADAPQATRPAVAQALAEAGQALEALQTHHALHDLPPIAMIRVDRRGPLEPPAQAIANRQAALDREA